MVDSISTHMSLSISIGTVMRNPEMLKFVPDHLKTKQMCNYAVQKLPFVIRYVSDQYKTKCVIKLLIIMLMH